ncbi:unnamed protein product [Urochloa humidicola]
MQTGVPVGSCSGVGSDFGFCFVLSVQPFKRFVEIGRLALVNYDKDYGHLVIIVDMVDQNRALLDAPDMVRCQMNFERLSLTDIKIDIKRLPKKTTLIKAMEEADPEIAKNCAVILGKSTILLVFSKTR